MARQILFFFCIGRNSPAPCNDCFVVDLKCLVPELASTPLFMHLTAKSLSIQRSISSPSKLFIAKLERQVDLVEGKVTQLVAVHLLVNDRREKMLAPLYFAAGTKRSKTDF